MLGFCLSASVAVSKESGITLELILSVIAIVVSVGSVFFEYYWNQKINRTNLEADFYRDIYGKYLMEDIPKARIEICHCDGTLSGTDELIDVLNNIRHASLFFKFQNKQYYTSLCNKLQGLEDKLVKKTGRMDRDTYENFLEEINKDLEDIYHIMMKKYVGKKTRG